MADEHNIELTPEIKVEDVVKSAKKLRSAIQSIFDGTEGKQLDSRLQSMKNKMSDIARKSDELTARLEQLSKTRVPTEQFKDISSAIDETTEKLKKLEKAQEDADKYGGARARRSKSYKQREEEIAELRQVLKEQQEYRSQMLAEGTAYMSGAESEEYQKLSDQQEQLNNKMRVYVESWNEAVAKQDQMAAGDLLREQRQELTGMTRTVTGLTSTLRGLGRIIPGVSTRGIMAISMIIRGVTKLSTLTSKDLVAALGVARAAFSKLFATIMAHPIVAIITAILAAVVALVKVLKKAISDTKKELEDISKFLSKGLQKSLNGALGTVTALGKAFLGLYPTTLKLTVKLLSMFVSGIKSLQGTITEGLKPIAQWNNGLNKTNTALSNLTSSLEYVKSSLSTAFAPIITVIEPLLTRFLNLLAEAITLVGMFTAKLSGATSFQKAIRQQKDYAKSLEGVGSAADEAKQKLASYDKLQVISQDKSSGSGAGMNFEEVSLQDFELPEWLTNLYDLGVKAGTKLRDLLNNIPWEKVQKGAKNAANGIADFLNGMTSVANLGDSVGNALGSVVNTLTTFINTLLTGVNFGQIGKQLKDMLTNFLKTTDFKDVGKIFSNLVNSISDFLINLFSGKDLGVDFGKGLTNLISGAFGDIDWNKVKEASKSIGSNIGAFLNESITPENLGLLGTSLGETINTIVTNLAELSRTADWKQFGDSIAESINNFFATVDWEFAGETITNLAKNILNMLLKVVDRVNWDEVSDSLIEFISNIDWKGIAKKATEISKKLREGLKAVWKELSDSDAFDDIIDLIVDFLKEKKNWEKAFKRIKSQVIREVIWEKFVSALEGIGETIMKYIGYSFDLFSFVGDLFDTLQKDIENKDWVSLGLDILNGLMAALLAPFTFIAAPFGVLFDWIWNGICDIFGISSPAKEMNSIGENIILGILDGFGLVDFGKKMTEWWDKNVAPWFTLEKWIGIKDNIVGIFKDIEGSIKIPINGIIKIVEFLINKIIEGINGLTSKLNTVGFDVKNPFNGDVYKLGFDIPQLNTVYIPKLAQGAVIPPNKEFAAILGDQKSGVNIETPLETMIQAFRQVVSEMGGNKEPIVLQLNGRTVAQVVWDEEAKRYKQINRYRTT